MVEYKNAQPRGAEIYLPGTCVDVNGELAVDLTFASKWTAETPEDSSVGIVVHNNTERGGANLDRLSLFHFKRTGEVVLGHRHHGQADFTVVGRFNEGLQKYSLKVTGDGTSVTVGLPDGAARAVPLKEPLYADGRTIRCSVQTGAYSQVSVSEFAISGAFGPDQGSVQPTGSTLRDTASAKGVSVGVAINMLRPAYDPRSDLLTIKQFDHIHLAWDAAQWKSVRPQRDVFDFSRTDSLVNFALQAGRRAVGLHLVDRVNDAYPAWLLQTPFTRDEMIGLLREYITEIVHRYDGKVDQWIVVNEPVMPTGLSDNIWSRSIGTDFVDLAFQAAREASPGMKLYLNDYLVEIPSSKSDRYFELAQRLKMSGLLDGVGFQMHLRIGDAPDARGYRVGRDAWLTTMRRFGDLGVVVDITELDVNVYGAGGTLDERLQKQADVYREVVGAALETGLCRNITLMGLADADSWLEGPPTGQLLGTQEGANIFDRSFQPKPALFALRDTLS